MKAIPWLLLLFALGGCTQKYVSPYHLPATANLVVEGFVNVGNGPTNFTLSRASSLDSPVIIPQTGAQVIVETQGGGSFPLTELGNGNYSFSQIPVDLTQQYRLRITTPDGKEYLSDFAMAKLTPPVDSVSWKLATDEINIYVSSHDPQSNTRYYQWKYEETWKYTEIVKLEDLHDWGPQTTNPDYVPETMPYPDLTERERRLIINYYAINRVQISSDMRLIEGLERSNDHLMKMIDEILDK